MPKSAADHSISRQLLPNLITFTTATDNEDPENARALVSHALTAFVTTLKAEQKPLAMGIIAPTLLERANKEGEAVYRETSARLLELAGADQVAFRNIVGGMTEEQKGFMESVIVAGRKAQAAQLARGNSEREESGAPTIALRMDFGS
jgi:hypothetical protein